VQLGPAVGNVGSTISTDGIEPPLAQRKLAVEAVDDIQTEADDSHHSPDAQDGVPEGVQYSLGNQDLDQDNDENSNGDKAESTFIFEHFNNPPDLSFLLFGLTENTGGAH